MNIIKISLYSVFNLIYMSTGGLQFCYAQWPFLEPICICDVIFG